MAARVKDAFSRATPFPITKNHHPKAIIAETTATTTNIESDSAFSEAYSKLDEAGLDATTDDPSPQTTPPRRRSSAATTATTTTARSSSVGGDPRAVHEKYKLRVTAGPSYDPSTHALVHVNTPHTVLVSNQHLTARIAVRIKDFSGLPSASPPTSPYFAAPQHARNRDRYSISFSFVPKHDIPADEAVWGPDCARPVRDRLPPGFNMALRIVKGWVDPSIEVDAYADEPWVYGPALCCWYAMRVGEKVGVGAEVPPPQRTEELDEGDVVGKGVGVLEEGADGDGERVRREWGCPSEAPKRRKYFVDEKKRKGVVFEEGRLYQGDFFNPHIDFDSKCMVVLLFALSSCRCCGGKRPCRLC